jgi:nucleotide-binding universal stress UspA family protein
MRTILIATDGSPGAVAAVAFGLELAAAQGASATLLEVIPPTDWTSLDRGSVLRPLPEELAWRRDAGLEAAAALAAEHGVALRLDVLAGDPADEIVAYADNHHVDLVVLGSRGRGAIAGALLGSVSETVLHEARRPVLVVRGVREHADMAIGAP